MKISFFSFLLLTLSILTASSQASSNIESFIFSGCSRLKFTLGSAYESNLNSLLTTLGNSAMFHNYNNFTVQGATQEDTMYGLFQCRGDVNGGDCLQCVARAVIKLRTRCLNSFGGKLQLDGCFVMYDNSSFVGVQDTTVVMSKCGPSTELTYDGLTVIDDVLAILGTCDGINNTFRVSDFERFQGVAQCIEDLSPSECQGCLSEAIRRLRTECGGGAWGQMYLGKCYARYSESENSSPRSRGHDNKVKVNIDKVGRTLGLITGGIAGGAAITISITIAHKRHKRGSKSSISKVDSNSGKGGGEGGDDSANNIDDNKGDDGRSGGVDDDSDNNDNNKGGDGSGSNYEDKGDDNGADNNNNGYVSDCDCGCGQGVMGNSYIPITYDVMRHL